MTGYADPERLVADWLHTQLGCKMWAEPHLPQRWTFDAPIGLVQRGQGLGDTRLTLDTALVDVDFYAQVADHVRDLAEQARYQLRVRLPLTTLTGGVLVTAVDTVSAPAWAPDPDAYRRAAAYQITFAGMLP